MRFATLGSGSKGNCCLVESGRTTVMIDCGFGLKETEARLARLGKSPIEINGLLVTHEHGDHIRGVGPLARKYRIPVYLTHGTARHDGLGKIPKYQIIDPHQSFNLNNLEITPVIVPHDAREPVQYTVSDGQRRFGILTDLGSLTPHIIEQYRDCDALMLESNHCPELLQFGPYPPSLKIRVAGNFGHLSNQQAASFLNQMSTDQLQHLVVSHISEKNNDIDRAVTLLADALGCEQDWITVAAQDEVMEWRQIA